MGLREVIIIITYSIIMGFLLFQILQAFEYDILYVMKKKIKRDTDKRRLLVGMMLMILYSLLIYFGILDLTNLII